MGASKKNPKRPPAPKRGADGRFLSKRPPALHDTDQVAPRKTPAPPRGADGRFLSKRQIAARKGAAKRLEKARRKREGVERAKATKAQKVAVKEQRRARAKLAWERKKALEAAYREKVRTREEGPSEHMRALFDDAGWFNSGWYVFPETGEEEGLIEILAGGRPRARSIELEQFLLPYLVNEPVWLQVGCSFKAPKGVGEDRYDKHAGAQAIWTHPRDAHNAPHLFLGLRQIMGNLTQAQFKVETIMVRVRFGARPARHKPRKRKKG